LTQWLTEHGINVSTDSASLANLASQEEMFLNPRLKQVEKLQVDYHRHNKALLADIDNQVKDSLNLIHRQAGQSRIVLVVVSLIVLFILIAGGYWLVRRMRKSLGSAIEVLNRLVQG